MDPASQQKSAIGKFANQLTKATTGYQKHIEKVNTLSATLYNEPQHILNHLMKEQGFANEESIVEKNEVFLNKVLYSQKIAIESFLGTIKGEVTEMRDDIRTINHTVKNL